MRLAGPLGDLSASFGPTHGVSAHSSAVGEAQIGATFAVHTPASTRGGEMEMR